MRVMRELAAFVGCEARDLALLPNATTGGLPPLLPPTHWPPPPPLWLRCHFRLAVVWQGDASLASLCWSAGNCMNTVLESSAFRRCNLRPRLQG